MIELWMSFSLAHAGAGAHDMAAGVMHPMTGWDHAAAMVALGLASFQGRGAARWVAPVGFVAAMVIGGALAVDGVSVPLVEAGIPASVLVFGLLVASALRVPVLFGAVIAFVFGVFHGHAHLAELVPGESVVAYTAGLVLGSVMVIGAGVVLGRTLVAVNRAGAVRWVGAATAVLALMAAVTRL